MRPFSRHKFETRSLAATRGGYTFYIADPSAPFTRLRAGYGAAGEITLIDPVRGSE